MPQFIRLGLSLIVAAGCWTGPAFAQATPAPVNQAPVTQTPVIITDIQAPASAGAHEAPIRPGIRLAPWPLRQGDRAADRRDRWNEKGYHCQSHIDWYGCGSWRAQCEFVFGSCRRFFAEPCLPAAPHGFGAGLSGGFGAAAPCGR